MTTAELIKNLCKQQNISVADVLVSLGRTYTKNCSETL